MGMLKSIMLQNLPIILSSGSFLLFPKLCLSSPIIPKLIPRICAKTSKLVRVST